MLKLFKWLARNAADGLNRTRQWDVDLSCEFDGTSRRRGSDNLPVKDMPGRGTANTFIQLTMSTGFQWTIQNTAQVGVNYNPTTNSSNVTKRLPFGTSAGNTQTGGGDQAFSFYTGITAGDSVTVNLDAMENLLQQTGIALARAKLIQIHLLSAADDPTISPAPTATSTVTVTNMGPTEPSPWTFQTGSPNQQTGTSGATVTLTVGSTIVTGVAVGAGGTGYPPSSVLLMSPVQAGGSGCAFAAVTNGSGVITSMVFVAGGGGTGYTAATVPTVVVGYQTILTGGVMLYGDPAPAGFLPITATQKNLTFINNDPANAITFELDLAGCTT
jgi:hypothetical protein